MITVLGLGSFGYAWLCYLDKNIPSKIQIRGWNRTSIISKHISKNRSHLNIPSNMRLSKRVVVFDNAKDAVKNASIVVSAVSSEGVIPTLQKIRYDVPKTAAFFNTAKALSPNGTYFCEECEKYLPRGKQQYGFIAGATKAESLQRNKFSTATLAHPDVEKAKNIATKLSSDNVVLTPTTHVETTEIAGTSKNIISLLYGFMKGKKYSDTKVQHGFVELKKSFEETNLGLLKEELSPAWRTDVLMSAHSDTRNLSFGKKLAHNIHVNPEETVEGWESLQKTPQNNTLSNVPRVKASYDLLVTKKIGLEQWEETMFTH